MITQQDIVARLNKLTVHYNLNWDDVKYEADMAIAAINSFMGTNYPKMTDHLISAQSTYTVNSGGVNIPIFPEEYIHSVVIPYIAMEILAQDEEFTTVYNKYNIDLDNGLFTMLQKEFNNVPFVFRQQPNVGVFFGAEESVKSTYIRSDALDPLNNAVFIERNNKQQLPTFKFRVHYHINNSDVILSSDTAMKFIEDTQAYEYGESATVLDWNIDLLSFSGAEAYQFKGWVRDSLQSGTINPGDAITMKSDIHLYALWEIVSTFNIGVGVSNYGELSIKENYKDKLTHINIPSRVMNVPVTSICSNFLLGATRLQTVALPSTVATIKTNAFKDAPVLERVVITEGVACSIGTGAFANTPKLTSIIIPYNVTAIAPGAFPVVLGKHLDIICKIIEINKPAAWEAGWYAPTSDTYTVEIVWGYNG